MAKQSISSDRRKSKDTANYPPQPVLASTGKEESHTNVSLLLRSENEDSYRMTKAVNN